MIKRQTIQRTALLASLFCALSLSLKLIPAAHPKELILDRRITESSVGRQLIPQKSREQTTTQRTDRQEQWRGCATGISNTPGGWDAYRASNLAASKHYAEAIEELTKAISCYDTPQLGELNPAWLVKRAELFRLVGLDKQALADIKRALTLKRCYDTEKFQCAKALIEYGDCADAESVLKPLAESGTSIFRSYHYYLLAIAQEKQGKTDAAIASYKQAATLFASSGQSGPTQACLDAADTLSGKAPGNKPLSTADLTPPKSNVDKIENLIKALMTKDDVFDIDKLKELIDASEIKEINTGFLVSPFRGHLKELNLVTIDKLPTGGLRLQIHMEPTLCSVDRSAFAPMAKDKIDVQQMLRADLGHSEGFKVPSGTIIFTLLDHGFKPIQSIELYSREASYPQPSSSPQPNSSPALAKAPSNSSSAPASAPVSPSSSASPSAPLSPSPSPSQPGNPQATTKSSTNYYRLMEIYGGRPELSAQAEKLVENWLKEEPESPSAHMQRAEIYASQGKYEDALKAIETAQRFQKNDEGLRNEYGGDVLTIKRGSYLLEQGKYKEALEEFKKGFPNNDNLAPDHLLMRGRAELGLKNYQEAAKDLNNASQKFYNECRIVKRDEAQKLLKSIPGSILAGPVTPKQLLALAEQNQRAQKQNQAFIEEQKRQTAIRMKALEEKTQKERQEKEEKYQEAINKAQQKLTEAKQQQATKPDQYIMALLNMASQCSRQQKTEDAKQYLDQAIECYEHYTPRPEYDSCTRALASEISTLKNQDFDTRIDRVINRSELFCKSEKFRNERDRFILDITRYRSVEEVPLLQKLIKVREEMQPETGASPNSLYRYLSSAYEKKRDEKQAVWALEKAIEYSQTNKTRCLLHTDLARLFLRQKKLEQAKKQWPKALATIDWQHPHGQISSFALLARAFCQEGDRATCKDILWKILNNADGQSLKQIDRTLGELIKELESARDYTTAEALLTKRIEKGLATTHDDSITDWQMQLSDFYLITDRQALSEKLYKQARESAFFQGDTVEGIDLRRKESLLRAGMKQPEAKSSVQEATTKSITFPHVLYAFSELSLNGNTSTGSCDTRLQKARPSFPSSKDENGDVCSLGKVEITGNATVNGTTYRKLPADASQMPSNLRRWSRSPVNWQAIIQPKSIITKGSSNRTKLGDFKGRMELAGGDYEATSISSLYLQRNLTKPVRIFITDDSTVERYAVKLGSSFSSNPPENLQIWYLGYRPMVFEHNSNVSAVVYAPYSNLTMGDNNCRFHGAIVANKITTIGNVSAIYDKALEGKVFTPSQP